MPSHNLYCLNVSCIINFHMQYELFFTCKINVSVCMLPPLCIYICGFYFLPVIWINWSLWTLYTVLGFWFKTTNKRAILVFITLFFCYLLLIISNEFFPFVTLWKKSIDISPPHKVNSIECMDLLMEMSHTGAIGSPQPETKNRSPFLYVS